ncbi:ABC transporter permease [Sulfuriferula plumbiphila]|uniref:ABC transporter permease n=1 Tax=Sulfuriferula plumbiphila TaxID=171865 RepID=A0A512LCB1_9PROT|nr:ABC transporter permease [Sulfuriferula plumbiphila]BBP04759.1 ABC transporter permease [Sulfuriferula plumbiphila]GEP32123.1 ABC transporter permease [Sulfuriferula plumbiphila]
MIANPIEKSAVPSFSWRNKLARRLRSIDFWQGVLGIATFLLVWQVARSIGLLHVVPGPLEVVRGTPDVMRQSDYLLSWTNSSKRVFFGFVIAAVLAITIGVPMGMSRKFKDMVFPVFEVIRPIPPLAWLPISILFWPSSEMTMVYLTFLGAFFPILINVLAGIDNIDIRYIQAALSLGASKRSLFWKILVPGALPSLFTGLTIAVAITWEVVIAAEMASGDNGLGYLTWNAYMSHSMVGILVGMLSIGIAGIVSSLMVSWFGRRVMPWLKK